MVIFLVNSRYIAPSITAPGVLCVCVLGGGITVRFNVGVQKCHLMRFLGGLGVLERDACVNPPPLMIVVCMLVPMSKGSTPLHSTLLYSHCILVYQWAAERGDRYTTTTNQNLNRTNCSSFSSQPMASHASPQRI